MRKSIGFLILGAILGLLVTACADSVLESRLPTDTPPTAALLVLPTVVADEVTAELPTVSAASNQATSLPTLLFQSVISPDSAPTVPATLATQANQTTAHLASTTPAIKIAATARPKPTATLTSNKAKTTLTPGTSRPVQLPSPTPRETPTPTPTPIPTPTPTPTPNPHQELTEVFKGKTGRKQVAITLDAGAGSEPFPKMLQALTEADVKITFFLTGTWAQQNPTFVQQIVENGHEIGNHSWSHPDHTSLKDEQIKSETAKTEELLSKFSGRPTQPLWRAPYGARNGRVLEIMKNLGYRNIMWTIDSLDSVGPPKSVNFLIERVSKQTDAQLDGEIILMHIGNLTTAEALPVILKNLKERGFQVVTVSAILA